MGLLTSAEGGGGERLSAALTRWGNFISALAYLAGLVTFAALIHPDLNDPTYFSENALLPNLVDQEFGQGEDYRRFLSQAAAFSDWSSRLDWAAEAFQSIAVETHFQNFSMVRPFASRVEGRNLYTIVRAPREASREALVLVSSGTAEEISFFLALATFARPQIYWAKDLIFLIAPQGEVGVGAWLGAYHAKAPRDDGSVWDALEARGGQIQAALGLELKSSGPWSHIDLRFQGLNGQMPNLDLLNLLVKVVRDEGLTPTLYEVVQDSEPLPFAEGIYALHLRTMAKGMLQQASCRGDGLHSLFGGFGIEAATLRPFFLPHSPYTAQPNDLGRIFEGSLRSLNNLLERFHQSFFFYLRPSPTRYISIGLYAPPLGLLLLAPLIKALDLWLRMSSEEEAAEKERVEKERRGEEREKDLRRKYSQEARKAELGSSDRSLIGALPYLGITHLLGFACLCMPKLVRWFDAERRVVDESGGGGGAVLLSGIAGVFVVAASVPFSLSGRRRESWRASGKMLRCLTLLQLSLVLATTALLNFSLGFGLALLYVPVFLAAKGRRRGLARLLTKALVGASNPLLLYMAASLYAEGWDFGSWDWGLGGLQGFLLDYSLHRSWLLPFASFGLVPLWSQAWILANDLPVIASPS